MKGIVHALRQMDKNNCTIGDELMDIKGEGRRFGTVFD